MDYEKFKQEQEKKNFLQRREADKMYNRSYNKGLLKGLGFWKAYLYPALKRVDT